MPLIIEKIDTLKTYIFFFFFGKLSFKKKEKIYRDNDISINISGNDRNFVKNAFSVHKIVHILFNISIIINHLHKIFFIFWSKIAIRFAKENSIRRSFNLCNIIYICDKGLMTPNKIIWQ